MVSDNNLVPSQKLSPNLLIYTLRSLIVVSAFSASGGCGRACGLFLFSPPDELLPTLFRGDEERLVVVADLLSWSTSEVLEKEPDVVFAFLLCTGSVMAHGTCERKSDATKVVLAGQYAYLWIITRHSNFYFYLKELWQQNLIFEPVTNATT